jgi:hypothetical protein
MSIRVQSYGSIVTEESYLDEADVLALLTEALTADVEAVLADKTGPVGADTAIQRIPSA